MGNSGEISLRSIFLGLQEAMIAELSSSRKNVPHPTAKGTISESGWQTMLDSYLPRRYQVEKAFVLDSNGKLSEEIDIVIYDRQYSPFLFKKEGAKYIPAESVYGVLEVKQDLGRDEILYAGEKVKSVRELYRTSAPIPHAGGEFKPRSQFELLAGIVALGSGWSKFNQQNISSAINRLSDIERIDLGCALEFGSFQVEYDSEGKPTIEISSSSDALISFFLNLLARLQRLGTVPAVDFKQYARSLTN